jgi:hypothetical protein
LTRYLLIAALITPSTLIVGSSGVLDVHSTSHVPTLNFNDTSLYETMGLGDSSSPVLHRLTLATATGMQILPMKRVLAINTSYTHEFEGPSLNCEVAIGYRLQNISAVLNKTKQQVLVAADLRLGDADIKYLSHTRDEDGVSTNRTYNVTTFVSEYVVGNTLKSCDASGGPYDKPVLWARMGNESITCAVHNTHFNVYVVAPGSTQTMTRVDFEWKERMKTLVTNNTFNALASLLNGFFGMFTNGGASGGYFSGKTIIADTALLELLQRSFERLRVTVPQEDWMASENRTFLEMVEELSRNQPLSLSSSEKLWLPMESTNLTKVVHTSSQAVYEYRPYNLWLAYGIAIALSFDAVLLGLHALWLNGVSHDNSFSSIMASTRNAYLDELTLGHSLGATPMSKEILQTRLRFGELEEGMEKLRPRGGLWARRDDPAAEEGATCILGRNSSDIS